MIRTLSSIAIAVRTTEQVATELVGAETAQRLINESDKSSN